MTQLTFLSGTLSGADEILRFWMGSPVTNPEIRDIPAYIVSTNSFSAQPGRKRKVAGTLSRSVINLPEGQLFMVYSKLVGAGSLRAAASPDIFALLCRARDDAHYQTVRSPHTPEHIMLEGRFDVMPVSDEVAKASHVNIIKSAHINVIREGTPSPVYETTKVAVEGEEIEIKRSVEIRRLEI